MASGPGWRPSAGAGSSRLVARAAARSCPPEPKRPRSRRGGLAAGKPAGQSCKILRPRNRPRRRRCASSDGRIFCVRRRADASTPKGSPCRRRARAAARLLARPLVSASPLRKRLETRSFGTAFADASRKLFASPALFRRGPAATMYSSPASRPFGSHFLRCRPRSSEQSAGSRDRTEGRPAAIGPKAATAATPDGLRAAKPSDLESRRGFRPPARDCADGARSDARGLRQRPRKAPAAPGSAVSA